MLKNKKGGAKDKHFLIKTSLDLLIYGISLNEKYSAF